MAEMKEEGKKIFKRTAQLIDLSNKTFYEKNLNTALRVSLGRCDGFTEGREPERTICEKGAFEEYQRWDGKKDWSHRYDYH